MNNEEIVDGFKEFLYGVQKGTFKWAVEQMRQGKKVRRKDWLVKTFSCFSGETNLLYYGDDINYYANLTLQDFEATDWKIFEENTFGDFKVDKTGAIDSICNDSCVSFSQKLDDFLEPEIVKIMYNSIKELKNE